MKSGATRSAAPVRGNPRGTFTLSKTLQRKCACGSKAKSGAEQCNECSKTSGALQAKMRVGGADDVLEREADQAADRALASVVPAQLTGSNGAEPLVRRRASVGSGGTHDAPASVGDTLHASGALLDSASRQFFESRFSHDFSRVRVHTGSSAEQSADEVGARAYTVGSNVVFARGEYAPHSADGRRLLAHELAHVVQQDSAPAAVVRRQPNKKREETARVLSLTEIDKDPTRKQRRKDTGQDRAWIYRSTKPGGVKTAVFLKAGDEATIVEELTGGVWFSILGKGISGFGPKEVLYVHSAFLEIIPHAVVSDPKPIPAPPKAAEPPVKPDEPPTKGQQMRAILENWPAKEKWQGDERAPRTKALINALRFCKYLWFQHPEHRAWATEYITNYHKKHIETSFNEWEFEKKVGRRLAYDQTYRWLFLGVRDALGHLKRFANGDGQGTAAHMWKEQLDAIERAAEPISVMLDDLKPGELKQTGQLQSLQNYDAPRAFLSGVLEGAKSQLSDEDYKKLSEKLATSATFALPLMPVAAAGAVKGIAKDIKEQLEGIYEILTKPGEMAEQMAQLITTLMFDKEGARQVGLAMGEQEGKDIAKLANEDVISFTFNLYEKVAPMVVSVVISIISGGSAGAARVSAALEKFLRSSTKASSIVKKIEAMLPEKKVPNLPPKSHAPGVPDAPAADLAAATRKWAKETLDFTPETLNDLSPTAIKKLQALPKEDLTRIRQLSAKAQRYLLDCHSPCEVDGPDIKKQLAQKNNAQIELDAKAAEKALAEIAKLDLTQLRQRARTDKMAAEVLQERYAVMPNPELRKLAKKGHAGAQAALDANAPENTALKKIGKGQGNFSQREVLDLLEKDLKKARKDSGINRTGRTAVTPNDPVKGGTMATARTNVPGLEGDLTVGRSPAAGGKVNPDSEFAPDTDLKKLPQTHGHAEQNVADQIAKKLSSVDPKDLAEKRVWMLVEQEPCSTCAQGIAGLHAPGVLVKLSKKFPDVIFEIKNSTTSGLIRIRNGIPLEQ
jgi:hypothetical protein